MIKKYLIIAYLLICSSAINQLKSQDIPFNCDYSAYLFQYNDVYSIDLASGSSYLIATDITPGNINAAAYNPVDGYIWGSLSTPARTIVRIGKNFNVQTYNVPELPSNNRYVGDVSSDGVYYLKSGGTTFYKIDLDPSSSNYTGFIEQGTLSQGISIHDWAFNAVDGLLYTVEKNSNHLHRINPQNGNVTDLGEVPILSGNNYTYGAVYFDASGRFYVSANQTGTIYVVYDVQNLTTGSNINSNLFAYGPSSSSNDGARCPTAPVPQEICNNGIDDDGDGLTDCEDPACSGVSNCPPSGGASSGNNGGLESNNRLSKKINQRNYSRVRTGFKFSKEEAKSIDKGPQYGLKNRSTNFELNDFVPLGVLEGTQAIESTPMDLLEITNATEVVSVDYDKAGETIAALLLLKTEEGVYEHTKYICDRLLGAELISVSTLEVNDQNFIKSVIRNPDGRVEFVLSFSARMTNNDLSFIVESHWNLDKYQENEGFYNFQIWADSLDDLYLLGSEVIRLLEIQLPVEEFILSEPPSVFVKSGFYQNGELKLEIMNTDKSEQLLLEGGLSRTETSPTESFAKNLNLETDLINEFVITTGSIFDFGFRITNQDNDIPDDLFMSDGPWGIDDFAISTIIDSYEVSENNTTSVEGYLIERNVSFVASTSEYVSVYRAFTPRYQPVDLSAYKTVEFESKGSGSVEVTLIKSDISNWEDQFRTTVNVTDIMEHYAIPYGDFSSKLGGDLELNNVTTIVFTMVSDDGTQQIKNLKLENLQFTEREVISDMSYSQNQISIVPNPLEKVGTFYFESTRAQQLGLKIYDLTGKLIKSENFMAVEGPNRVAFDKAHLKSGIYFVKIGNSSNHYEPCKLVIK